MDQFQSVRGFSHRATPVDSAMQDDTARDGTCTLGVLCSFHSRKTAFLMTLGIVLFTNVILALTMRSPTVMMKPGDVSSSTKPPPPVAEKMSSNQSSLSERLWHFESSEYEKLYLYNAALRREHSFNESNINDFRRELSQSIGQKSWDRIIVDQKNAFINSVIHFNDKHSKRPNFHVHASFHRRLPEEVRIGRLKKCSVVGNSGTLSNSSCGGDIDSSHFVFRCNAAPLKRFQADAGRKSNLTSFNPSIIGLRYGGLKTTEQWRRFQDDMRDYRGFVLAFCFSTSVQTKDCLKIFYRYKIAENKLVMGHPDHFLRLLEFWAERKLTRRLSTGFYFTNVAIYHCDEVHLYGFWPFANVVNQETVRTVPYHYFDRMKFDFQIKGRKTHHMDKEFSTLLQLHSLGVIKIHTDRCN